jgi:hypothetical protein
VRAFTASRSGSSSERASGFVTAASRAENCCAACRALATSINKSPSSAGVPAASGSTSGCSSSKKCRSLAAGSRSVCHAAFKSSNAPAEPPASGCRCALNAKNRAFSSSASTHGARAIEKVAK